MISHEKSEQSPQSDPFWYDSWLELVVPDQETPFSTIKSAMILPLVAERGWKNVHTEAVAYEVEGVKVRRFTSYQVPEFELIKFLQVDHIGPLGFVKAGVKVISEQPRAIRYHGSDYYGVLYNKILYILVPNR